jgi:putative transposase
MKNVYPVAVSCHVLQVSTSGYFRFRRSGGEVSHLCSDDLALTHIRAIHAEVKGEYGWPRIHKELQARSLRIGKERVRKLMASHSIRAKTKRKFVVTTDSKHSLPVAPDLV